MTETTKRLALGAFSVAISLLMLEAAVRVIEPKEVLREYFMKPDPVLHHKFLPGGHGFHKTPEFNAAYTINSLGLRDREMPRQKPAGVHRILMLGDSFTEGNGVNAPETFSARLQEMLDRGGLGTRWQVINAGVGSYSPLLEYLYLENGGLDLQPDLVILSLDMSDIYDDIQYTALARFDASGNPIAVAPEPERAKGSALREALVGIKDFLKEHTRTYNFVRRRIGGYVEASRHKANFSGDVRLDKYGMLRPGAQDDKAWSLTYGYLLRIRDVLAARGIDFWIAVYPYGLQISPREWAAGRQYWGFERDKVYSTRPQELVERFGREHGIPVVNMTADFVERSRAVFPLYFEEDGHWRPAGHEVAAGALSRALVPYLQAREAKPAVVPAPR